ncbi:ATP-binding cassette domain-containing protein [Flaviaesturariibacter amylovorans]|uniref:ABC transporter domain-containing protein n=1 Tax=Flaviaesturariibacter amylovorans TaxID=1084520 RepID=A0ABP8HRK6_9BACT
MNAPLFTIENLACAYNRQEDDAVLRIKHLEIPQGKLVFLLGASGCGKSTLLETLGLMNNTVADGSITFTPADGNKPVDIAKLWDRGAYQELNTVRKRYYSFIFQNTNLMENFTAYENVCLSGMIKENVAQAKVLPEAQTLMARVKLPQSEVDLETLAVNLSGGQRQRLAFVRALTNQATVLFGDEPTGNLDEANAHELFATIKSNLNGGLSAIVVSHDIDLAVAYADQIIVITKEPEKGYGEVHDRNIFNAPDWEGLDDSGIERFKRRLRSYYVAANENKVQTAAGKGNVNTGITYRQLFQRKEGRVLLGRQFMNLWVLSLILFFTFLAIGFANGGLDYLNKKMSSAFVNWVKISIPVLRADKEKVKELVDVLESPNNKTAFNYQSVTPFVTSVAFVYNHAEKEYNPAKTRSVDMDRDARLVQEFVLAPKNVIAGRPEGFRNKSDMAVIVTERFLRDYGYPADADHILMRMSRADTSAGQSRMVPVSMPIPIRTIVSELPGRLDLVYPLYFYKAYVNNSATLDPGQNVKSFFLFYYGKDQEKARKIKTAYADFLSKDARYSSFQPEVFLEADTFGFKPGYTFQVQFLEPFPTYGTLDSLQKKLVSLAAGQAKPEEFVRTYMYSEVEQYSDPYYDQISVYFNNLDRVRDFSKFLLTKFNTQSDNYLIEVDINQVKEKENINFLSNVTYTISILLVVFSTLAVGLFIFNLLKSHLSKVKMNIGTFKAIGLADREARSIYMGIILMFILVSTLLALVLASATGLLLDRFLTMNMVVEQDINYFKIVDANTAIALAVVLASSIAISWMTIKKILNKTPGDLIYNR